MALELTAEARLAALSNNINPNIVLTIDGVDEIFGAVEILRLVKIGDPGLLIDGSWLIGGSLSVEDQASLLSLDGSTTSIQQQLQPDRGIGSSVSSMDIKLVDINEEITRLISPGEVVADVLGRSCNVYLGFAGLSYPDDYVKLFRGVIDDIRAGAGYVILTISHPDQKKRQDLFIAGETSLNGGINNSVTTITVDDTSQFLAPVNGPSGSPDTSVIFAVRIDDEIIRYTGTTPTTLTGCTRGYLSTTAASHSTDTNVTSFFRLQGNVMDLSLKLMLSGWDGPFISGLTITNFNVVDDGSSVANSIFFETENVADTYGLIVGDYITTTGASNGANNVSLKQIESIVEDGNGVYLTITGVSFVDEEDTAGTISFRSQYDTLGAGCGLKMAPDEVDVTEHLTLQRRYLSSFDYDFYIKDTIQAKDFIEQELYLPCGAYSVPRKAKASVGFHIGPIPGLDIKTLSSENVSNASKIILRRTIARNFYNTVVYKFDEDVLEDKFLSGTVTTDATSRTRIPVGTRALTIISKGMRTSLDGVNLADDATERRLNRYKYAAEFFEKIEVLYGVGFAIEIGDLVLLDNDLNIVDSTSAVRGGSIKFYEVINKTIDIKTGKVSLSLTDINYSTAARYGLIGPASLIDTGISGTQFRITQTGNSLFGADEGGKWSRYTSPAVRVRSSNYVTRNATSVITNVSGNVITVSPTLGFTPQMGDKLEFAHYNSMSQQINLVYGFMRDTDPFDDGFNRYQML